MAAGGPSQSSREDTTEQIKLSVQWLEYARHQEGLGQACCNYTYQHYILRMYIVHQLVHYKQQTISFLGVTASRFGVALRNAQNSETICEMERVCNLPDDFPEGSAISPFLTFGAALRRTCSAPTSTWARPRCGTPPSGTRWTSVVVIRTLICENGEYKIFRQLNIPIGSVYYSNIEYINLDLTTQNLNFQFNHYKKNLFITGLIHSECQNLAHFRGIWENVIYPNKEYSFKSRSIRIIRIGIICHKRESTTAS